MLEYYLYPPFGVGTPEKAGVKLVELVKASGRDLLQASLTAAEKIKRSKE